MPILFLQPLFLFVWLLIPFTWVMMHRSSQRFSLHRVIVGGLRSLVILIMGFALAEPIYNQNSDRVNLFFVLDASDSIQAEQKNRAQELIQKASNQMTEKDMAGLIVFGKNPSLEISLKSNFSFQNTRSLLNTNFTDIYQALQLAIGKLSAEAGTNRILLLSDGNENINHSIDMAVLAHSLGIEIFSLPLESWRDKNEVNIEKLVTPTRVALESPFEIRVIISSSGKSKSNLILLRNGKLIANHDVTLQSGKNVFRLVDTISTQGIYTYKSVINPEEDTIFQNNEGLSFTYATKKSGILYLNDEETQETPLVAALRDQGYHVDAMHVRKLPNSMNSILDYKAIIMDNVPGSKLSDSDMENLENYVKDIGGGLIMVGGNQSFGAGDYQNTPIERALPVFMDIPSNINYTSLGIIFLIDKSNSMEGDLGGQNKLEAAKIAVFSAVELLNPKDEVGVIAFDESFSWVVPLTSAKNRRRVADQLVPLVAEGGTKLYKGLQQAIDSIIAVSSAKKHIIILSDGKIFDAGKGKKRLYSLIESIKDLNITLSTVAIGRQADIQFMERLSKMGRGRSYQTNDAGSIPRIFVDEVKRVTHAIINEKDLQPLSTPENDITAEHALNDFPMLLGMDLTFPKPDATVHLKTQRGPLLITRRYGLGKSLAFTSDLAGRWGKNWLNWDQYGKFISLMVKWVQKSDSSGRYSVQIERVEDRGYFLVDVTNQENHFLNALNLKLNILFPNPARPNLTIPLEQISPGQYKGLFPLEDIGEYYFNIYERNNDNVTGSQTFGYGIAYTKEFQNQKINHTLLKTLVEKTKGKLLGPEDDLEQLFTAKPNTGEEGIKLWPYLLLLSIFILMIDIVFRKLYTLGVFQRQ